MNYDWNIDENIQTIHCCFIIVYYSKLWNNEILKIKGLLCVNLLGKVLNYLCDLQKTNSESWNKLCNNLNI